MIAASNLAIFEALKVLKEDELQFQFYKGSCVLTTRLSLDRRLLGW